MASNTMILTFSAWLPRASDLVLDLLFPPQCVCCNADGSFLCDDCRRNIQPIDAPFCPVCGYPGARHPDDCRQCHSHPLHHLRGIRSVALFESRPLRTAIHKFKYQNYHVLAKSLAPLLATCYTTTKLNTETIVPVPLHRTRYKYRGYNQAELLANELAKLIHQPINAQTLIRHRSTKSQMTLNAVERQHNVANAFICRNNHLQNKTVLLIDDVCTTGATLDACAEAMRQAGAEAVFGLTLARAS